MRKFVFVELFVVYFSLPGERKVPKERHLRKAPTVPSLGIYPLDQRAILPGGKLANALFSRSLPWSRTVVRVTTARLVARLAATHGFPLSDK